MGGIEYSKRIKIIHFLLPILIIILTIGYFISWHQNSFDEAVFNENNVYEHIKELSSPKYNGRLAGSEGNKLAIEYVENYFERIGIEPAGEDNTYRQYFESVVPTIDESPIFHIKDKYGNILEEFEMYKDYRLYTSGEGGGIDTEGDILFVHRYLQKIRPELIKDRVIVMSGYILRDKDIDYVIANGGKGLLFSTNNSFGSTKYDNSMKSIAYGGKTGNTILLGILDIKAYAKIHKYANHDLLKDEYVNLNYKGTNEVPEFAGLLNGVRIKCNVDFPILESPNVLGKIQGKDNDGRYLIIGAHIDHVGSGTNDRYFPGALDNASGIGMMLELARTIKLQKNLPYRSIIFAAWNAEETGINGSKYYVENPIFPLKNTEVINIDCIGGVNAKEIIIESDGDIGNIIKNKIFQYAQDKKIKAKEYLGGIGSDHQPFIKGGVPAVNIADNTYHIHTYEDTIDNISKENLRNVGAILTNYIRRDVFKDTLPDYLNKIEILLIIIFVTVISFIYISHSLNKFNPNLKIFSCTIEDIYHSSAFNIISKTVYFVTPIFIVLFSLVFIANLPLNFNIILHNGHLNSNLSIFLTIKRSILYIRKLFLNGLGTSTNSVKVIDIVMASTIKSLKLILMTLIISFVFGMLKGIFDSYRSGRKGNLSTFTMILLLSLPDVLIVLCSMMLIINIANNEVLAQIINVKNLRGFIMPLLTLTIIPTVYISRITFISIQEELNKDYIKAAKAKGMSKLSIYLNHVFYGVVFKVIDSMPTLMTIIISNLIIVEYLFNYKGVVYNLYRFYKQNDVTSFIGLSIALGIIYVAFIMLFRLITRLLNPMKREGVF